MKLFDAFSRGAGARGFHTTVVTTFGVDFGAFEHVLMPQFEGAGATNVVLMGDDRMLALATTEGASRPLRAGSDYHLHPIRAVHGGVFHSKIVLQLGRSGARLVVGSANATGPGLGGNRELVAELSCSDKETPEQVIVGQAWGYLQRLAKRGGHAEIAATAFDWTRRRTPWLSAIDDVSPIALSDGTTAAFLAEEGDGSPSIMARFLSLLGAGPIDRLLIVSPYWDDTLAAPRELIEALSPAQTKLLVQPSQKLFPTHALHGLDARVYDIDGTETEARRFTHAKLIVASRGDVDHVLIGSANCTRAALGGITLPAVNDEICLYRTFPRGVIEEALALASVLAQAPLDAEALAPQALGKDLPLSDAAARLPGPFELQDAVLHWRPTASFVGAGVELIDKSAEVIARVEPGRWTQTADGWLACAPDIGVEAIRFARAAMAGMTSLEVVVAQPVMLAERRKERSSNKAARAAALVEDLDDFDLPMLEAMAELEREDDADETAGGRRPRVRSAKPEEEPKRLSYVDFMKARASADDPKQRRRNTLAGQSVDQVRATLNRILFDERDAAKASGLDPFDLGDDLGEQDGDNGSSAASGGSGNGGGRRSGASWRPPEPNLRPFDSETYAEAVRAFREGLVDRARTNRVRSREALRLRLMIMIIMGKADASTGISEARRLSCDDSATGWPRLVLNLCAGFFHDKPSPIAVMAMDERYTTLPDDLLEAWLTCLWALALAQHCLGRARPRSNLLRYFELLLGDVRAKSGLRSGDFHNPHAQRILQRLGDVYQTRLGVQHLKINAT